MFRLSCPLARKLSCDVAAIAGFVSSNIAVLRDVTARLPYELLELNCVKPTNFKKVEGVKLLFFPGD